MKPFDSLMDSFDMIVEEMLMNGLVITQMAWKFFTFFVSCVDMPLHIAFMTKFFCHTIRNHIWQLRLDSRVTSLSYLQWGCLCCHPPRPPGGLLEAAGGCLEVLNWSGVNHGIVDGCNTVNCRQPWKSFHVPWRYGSSGRARWPQHSYSFDMCRCERTFHILICSR